MNTLIKTTQQLEREAADQAKASGKRAPEIFTMQFEKHTSIAFRKTIGLHRRAKRQQLAAKDERAEAKANAHIRSRAFLERKLGKSRA